MGVMHKTNALQMRRCLGKVLRQLQRGGSPILVERNREPAAVLISLDDYRERFVDRVAAEERMQLVEEILAMRRKAARGGLSSEQIVREIRGALP
jgi:prevent-host-death family protein